MTIKLNKCRDNAIVPTKKTSGAAGYDLYVSNVSDTNEVLYNENDGTVFIAPGQTVRFGTGVIMEIPDGYEGQIRSRSGLAINDGLVVINSPGTIDSDFRGEIVVAIKNTSPTIKVIKMHDRIAQIVFARVNNVNFEITEYDNLSHTKRGENGFGSTGV